MNFLNYLAAPIAALALTAVASTGALAENDNFKEVLQRGVLRVGVQGGLNPLSYRTPEGEFVGLDIDVANRIAEAMGVDLEYIVVTSANRMEFLQQGKVDMILAGMSDTTERRGLVGIVEPSYFASGPTIFAKKGVISDWEDLRGKPVCGKQGVRYNRLVEQEYGANMVSFAGAPEAKEALRLGKCVAFVYDDVLLLQDLKEPEWADYELAVDALNPVPAVAAVPLDEVDGIWGNFLSGVLYRMIADGTIRELNDKWGIKSAYVEGLQAGMVYDRSHLE